MKDYVEESLELKLDEKSYSEDDLDEIKYKEITAGDTVKFTKRFLSDIVEKGNEFRVGPLVGECTDETDDTVTMTVKYNAYEEKSNDLKESLEDDKEFNDKYFPIVNLGDKARYKYYRLNGKEFAYDTKECLVIFLTKFQEEIEELGKSKAPYRELDAVGLRPENWNNKGLRDEYLDNYCADLDEEAREMEYNFMKYEYPYMKNESANNEDKRVVAVNMDVVVHKDYNPEIMEDYLSEILSDEGIEIAGLVLTGDSWSLKKYGYFDENGNQDNENKRVVAVNLDIVVNNDYDPTVEEDAIGQILSNNGIEVAGIDFPGKSWTTKQYGYFTEGLFAKKNKEKTPSDQMKDLAKSAQNDVDNLQSTMNKFRELTKKTEDEELIPDEDEETIDDLEPVDVIDEDDLDDLEISEYVISYQYTPDENTSMVGEVNMMATSREEVEEEFYKYHDKSEYTVLEITRSEDILKDSLEKDEDGEEIDNDQNDESPIEESENHDNKIDCDETKCEESVADNVTLNNNEDSHGTDEHPEDFTDVADTGNGENKNQVEDPEEDYRSDKALENGEDILTEDGDPDTFKDWQYTEDEVSDVAYELMNDGYCKDMEGPEIEDSLLFADHEVIGDAPYIFTMIEEDE